MLRKTKTINRGDVSIEFWRDELGSRWHHVWMKGGEGWRNVTSSDWEGVLPGPATWCIDY